MHEYIFILGRTGELCLAEARAIIEQYGLDFKILFSSSEILHFTVSHELLTKDLIKTLGGTIKIAEVMATIPGVDKGKIAAEVEKLLERTTDGKILFGISIYGSGKLSSLRIAETIKENLRKRKIVSRYVINGEEPLTSVQVVKHGLQEIVLFVEDKNVVLGKTMAVQDFEDWGKRDYGRPQVYPHEGMLPPKVARMMVNIACANAKCQISNAKCQVLDPFCGCGTVLAEAMMLGCKAMGGDISPKLAAATEKNLAWLRETYGLTSDYKIFQTDATHISEKISKVDVIVTEPFLGPNLEGEKELSFQEIKNIVRGLEKLYVGCFSDWRKVLNKEGAVAFIFPVFSSEDFVKKVLDKVIKLGYTVAVGPFEYGRPNAKVKRRIYLFNF